MNYDFLQQAYDQENWKALIRTLFPASVNIFASATPIPIPFDAEERIESFVQFGTLRLDDINDTQLALFEIRLRPNTTKLQINRVALRGIVEKINKQAYITGALAVYVDDETRKWRFSFIAKEERYNESGELITKETDPKRYTYVFGEGEKTLTARQRFTKLASLSHKSYTDIEEAFSVEKVSNEFFAHYKNQYQAFCQYLYTYAPAIELFSKLIEPDTDPDGDKLHKIMRDFAKKLLGRLVFLYFLQKKRWLGGGIGSGVWDDGQPDFIRSLFDRTPRREAFYSQVLAPLYFNTLNTNEKDRPGFAYTALGQAKAVKVPFLNGGLFEPDHPGTDNFDFPAQLFEGVLALFDRYNFTVDENSPNDHEVGIDPEMLGHIFENLLEENREKKGAFYTPKEIVHYMCQESLYQYLKEKLIPKVKPKGIIWSDSRTDDEKTLEAFVRQKRRGPKDGFVYKNGAAIAKALRAVRICDPAIGSGAFPMGLLYEIFHCHFELDIRDEDPGKLKREIIQNCIYGVDIDKGAVDIAQLRFWLALIVDEKEPRPLPNLDYKIMQGDSLLEQFENLDLSQLMEGDEERDSAKGPMPGVDLFNQSYQKILVFDEKEKNTIEAKLKKYYTVKDKKEKKKLDHEISVIVHKKIDQQLKRSKQKLFFDIGEVRRSVKRKEEIKQNTKTLKQKLARMEKVVEGYEGMQVRLHKSLTTAEKPFFLWNLYFKAVMEKNGGFDIVIGNPPYVQIQKLSDHYKTWLESAGYATFDKSSDLYALFYERGYKILRKGGFLAFITSNKWMRTNYGKGLRDFFVTKTNPLKLFDFGMAQNFSSAVTYTNILIFQKGSADRQIEICRAQNDYLPDTKIHTYFQEHAANIPDLNDSSWVAYTQKEYDIKAHVEKQGTPLEKKKYWDIDIYRGVLTGFNKAFIINSADKEVILAVEPGITGGKTPSEKLFKKILRGEDVRAWSPAWSDLWLVGTFPSLKLKIEEYPGIYQYLKSYQERLSPKPREHKGAWPGRKSGSYQWFETQDSISYYEDFSKPKIIYPNMTKYLPFTYDETGMFTNQKCFIITGEHLKYLTLFFNSKLFKFCFRHNFPELLGETYELSKVFFDKIPVKKPDSEIEVYCSRVTDYLTYLYGEIRAGHKSNTLSKIADFFEFLGNGLIYELYFEEKLKTTNRDILKHLPVFPALSNQANAFETITQLYQQLSERTHPVQVNLYYQSSIPEIKAIEDLNLDSKK